MDDGANPNPKQLARREACPERQRAREIRDALTVALCVSILGFDRAAPMTNCVEERMLEPRVASIDVRGNVAGAAKLHEGAMSAVEMRQRVAVAPLLATQLRL